MRTNQIYVDLCLTVCDEFDTCKQQVHKFFCMYTVVEKRVVGLVVVSLLWGIY